jgi:hypothetical protein
MRKTDLKYGKGTDLIVQAREPVDQGGEWYSKCRLCGVEYVGGARALAHRPDCPAQGAGVLRDLRWHDDRDEFDGYGRSLGLKCHQLDRIWTGAAPEDVLSDD